VRHSTDRILVSHAGNLPRPPEAEKLLVQVGGMEPGLMGKPGKMRHPELTGMSDGYAETPESGVE
jgi:hypothetical protein